MLLSYDIGAGLNSDDLAVWHLSGGVWSQFTPTQQTYSDGGIFSFGDAHFYGSLGGAHLKSPVSPSNCPFT